MDAAREDGADGVKDGAAAGGLHEVAARAGADGAFGVEGFVVHGQDEGGDVRMLGGDVLEQFKAVASREAEVGDDEVGAEGLDGSEGGRYVLGLPAHGEVRLVADHCGQALARDGVIIDQQDLVAASGLAAGLAFHGRGRRVRLGTGARCR